MSFGLLVRSADGRDVINADTFTVRYVTEFIIPGGTYSSARRFTVPLAKAGMFASGCALSAYDPVYSNADTFWGHHAGRLIRTLPRMPAFIVGDGWVEAYAPGGGSTRWSGNIQVLVFTPV